tara:strand:- start:5969 stop:6175 length:207 start_codon:yes stop_codon:yes gene_type:complete
MKKHESDEINTKGHPFVGVVWPVRGSKGDNYAVKMENFGFTCTCVAYRKCKHIKSVEAGICGPELDVE